MQGVSETQAAFPERTYSADMNISSQEKKTGCEDPSTGWSEGRAAWALHIALGPLKP